MHWLDFAKLICDQSTLRGKDENYQAPMLQPISQIETSGHFGRYDGQDGTVAGRNIT
jgi:hypothetical protein